MRRWDSSGPDADWTKGKTDVEIVEAFRTFVFGAHTHSHAGSHVRGMRNRLFKILVAGLHLQADRERPDRSGIRSALVQSSRCGESAIAAGARSDETRETAAQSEGRQSGGKAASPKVQP